MKMKMKMKKASTAGAYKFAMTHDQAIQRPAIQVATTPTVMRPPARHRWAAARSWALGMGLLALLASGVLLAQAVAPGAQSHVIPITRNNWGEVTSPVHGSVETNPNYASAELLAGPNKFGSYYSGVLPNGRKVTPQGISIQIGMNPLGMAITPDGHYILTSNDDERDRDLSSYQNKTNQGGYSLSVIDTTYMKVVSQFKMLSQVNQPEEWYIGMQVTGSGPYEVWVSGGGDNNVKMFTLSQIGVLTEGTAIPIKPMGPSRPDSVSNYVPGPGFLAKDAKGNLPPVPEQFNRSQNPAITFPTGSALSPDGRYLYVACNGDNSLAVIDTHTSRVIKQIAVGYFPYAVSVSADGSRIFVSNWGLLEYKFKNPHPDDTGMLSSLGTTGTNLPDGFYVPQVSAGAFSKSSSVTMLSAPHGDPAHLSVVGARYLGKVQDELIEVGGTHPSATAIVKHGTTEVLFVAQANSDRLARIVVGSSRRLADVDLSPLHHGFDFLLTPRGAYPNALSVSPDQKRMYVAEAGLNSVAVLDVSHPLRPFLLGRIPTGWYPAAVTVSADNRFLYVANAKGIGEDINPRIDPTTGTPPPSGMVSGAGIDSNFLFGSLQQIELKKLTLDNTTVLGNNFAVHRSNSSSASSSKTSTAVVPEGGAPSRKIKHVIFILHENKTFDSMLGNLKQHFGDFAGTSFRNADGSPEESPQFTGVSVNTQALATAFATGVNYYSDSEDSDAGHQFAASGTATDWTEKTLLVKGKRGMLVNKNMEPEDYPENGYIFNNAARNHVSFKDYGALVRIAGTDTGMSRPTTLNDPKSGDVGYPQLQSDRIHVTDPLVNLGIVTGATTGLGQSYFLALPALAILGGKNSNGEPRLDRNYPGFNFNISDQRRALEFITDFDRMAAAGTLPTFLYIYQPNDHTGKCIQARNADTVGNNPLQQVADGDVGLGMVVQHIMNSPVYYDADSGTGSAIFMTYDDAQATRDHLHPHRTPLIVISPFAKPGYVAKQHYSTASIVKTEELLVGLPPNNLGDLFATDLRDLFQSNYNGITAANVGFKVGDTVGKAVATVRMAPEAEQIWRLVDELDTSAPDRDSRRLGSLTRLSLQADQLHNTAEQAGTLTSAAYHLQQQELYAEALRTVRGPAE